MSTQPSYRKWTIRSVYETYEIQCTGVLKQVTIILVLPIPSSQLPFELGIIDASAVSVVTGVTSVLTVLPAAAMICFLFRLRDVKLRGSEAKRTEDMETENNFFEGVVLSFQ